MISGIKTIDDFNFKGKRVLLRVDLNSEIINGEVSLNKRIIEHAKTISELKKKGAKVIVIAHQGRPGSEDFISLEKHSRLLNKYVKIKFIKDIIGEKATSEIQNLKDGEAILLENIRFLKDEFKLEGKNKFVETLSKLCNIYVNDAFSVSHRAQASISLFPLIMGSCIGRVFEREFESLKKIDLKNSLIILGGNKVEDVVELVGKGKILSGGILSIEGLMAKGYDLGLENKLREKDKDIIEKLKGVKGLILPSDLAIYENKKRVDLELDEFPRNTRILDIGKKTISMYEKEIMKAKKIFFKGTLGHTGYKEFSLSTERILRTMKKSKAFCFIAGGHTSTAVEKLKIKEKDLGHVSISGGALIHYLAGRKLPGLEALQKSLKGKPY